MNPLAGLKNPLSASLSKQITEVWRLLNETALLLSRTAIRERFENQLAVLRSQIQRSPSNPAVIKEVSAGITELRKQLRLAGYDLSMGKYTLIFDGFRNDDCMADGFQRLVLFMGRDNFYWRTGEDNHMMLAAALDRILDKNPKREDIQEVHCLWFQRTKTTLTLSGAATETGDDYQRLKTAGEADSLFFLSKLKGLY
jgi:hypothetical protein